MGGWEGLEGWDGWFNGRGVFWWQSEFGEEGSMGAK